MAEESACNLVRVASLDLLVAPKGRAVFMPVTLNDVPSVMLLDTGGIYSTLTSHTVDVLHLPAKPGAPLLVNVAGQVMDRYAVIERFGFGGLRPARAEMLIEPKEDLLADLSDEIAGTIGPNLLQHYDVEIDLADARMNLFLPNDCVKAAYWAPAQSATVEIDVLSDGHIVFPIWLDGKEVQALLDTGMSFTTLDLPTAQDKFGVDIHAPGVESLGSLNGTERGTIYTRAFQTLATEHNGIVINNPRLALLPNLVGSVGVGSRAKVIVGLSTIQHLHLYIAYKRELIFVTPASGPPKITMVPRGNGEKHSAPDPVE